MIKKKSPKPSEVALFARWRRFEEGTPLNEEENLFGQWTDYLSSGGKPSNPSDAEQFAQWREQRKQVKKHVKLDHEIEMRVPPDLPNMKNKWKKKKR